MENDSSFMKQAFNEAQTAFYEDEVPVGCLIVSPYKEVLASTFNLKEKQNDPSAHAEILAIREAAKKLGDWRLNGCTAYVTLEPCPMCAGAIMLARIPTLVYAASDPKKGACGSIVDLPTDSRFNHVVDVTAGVLEQDSSDLLKSFFKGLRKSK